VGDLDAGVPELGGAVEEAALRSLIKGLKDSAELRRNLAQL